MKKLMKRIRAVDALYFSGAALVSAGAGLLCPPAGLIVAGVFLLVASVLTERVESENEPDGKSGGEDEA